MGYHDRPAEAKPAAVDRIGVPLAELHEILPAVDAEVPIDVGTGDVPALTVRSGDPSPSAPNQVVGDDRDLPVHALGADVPLHESARREVVVVEGPDLLGERELLELVHVDLSVAGHEHRDRPPAHVEHHALQRAGGADAQERRQRLDRRGVGGVDLGQRLLAGSSRLGRDRTGCLAVGEVVAVLALHEQVLAHCRARHELMVHSPPI